MTKNANSAPEFKGGTDGANEPPLLLDSKATAAALSISPRKLDELVAERRLRPVRIGRKRLFPRGQVEGFVRDLVRSAR